MGSLSSTRQSWAVTGQLLGIPELCSCSEHSVRASENRFPTTLDGAVEWFLAVC